MRLTPTLEELMSNDKFFPFDQELFSTLPVEFISAFITTFQNAYSGRRIGAQTPALFRNWCRAKFIGRRSYYEQLYSSLEVIKNPFINKSLQEGEKRNSAERARSYATEHTQKIHRDEGLTSDAGTSLSGSENTKVSANMSRSDGVNRDKNLTRNTNDSKTVSHETDLFWDTPQTPIQRDENGHIKDDYLTTQNSSDKTETSGSFAFGAGANTGTTNLISTTDSGELGASRVASTTKNVGNVQHHSEDQGVVNDLSASARALENNRINTVQGLEGVLVSDAVISWRKQMIPIIEMFVEEYRPFFLTVY